MTITWPPDLTDLPVRIGPYLLKEVLGEGGMARVYGATMRGRFGFRTRVAIKVPLPSHALAASDVAESLAREARLCGTLEHPNLARVRDVGALDGVPFVVMDRVDGPTVCDLLSAWGPLPPAIAVEIAAQICLGLEYAHEAGTWAIVAGGGPARPVRIVHRDLKPSNVMVDGSGLARVVDFGIARAMGPRDGPGASSAVGTPAYMSPEQLAGRPLGPRSDLFSLGLTLCEMVTGRRVLRGPSIAHLYAQLHRIDTLLSEGGVTAQLDTCCDGLGALVTDLLSLDPERRPGCAAEVGDLLGALGVAAGSRQLGRFVRGARTGWQDVRARARGAVVTTVPAPVHAAVGQPAAHAR